MKAIVYTKFGQPDVLELQNIEKPVLEDNQVLVKVIAASANALDWRPFTMPPLMVRLIRGGLLKPKNTSLGADIAGRVEAVGKNVTEFKPGDEVFGVAAGAFAEYACAAENKLALKPANLSFEAAAAVPVAAFTALQGLRDQARIQPGQKVLIYGASGGVGTFSVQIAKAFGAEVTAVCSTRNVGMVRSIGADQVIDYTKENFTQNGQHYDVILAVNGNHPILDYWRALNPAGVCVVLGGSMAQIFQGMLLGPLLSKLGKKKIGNMLAHSNQADLVVMSELLAAGKVVPVIDRCYPLVETAEAIQRLISEHPQGKVVIAVAQNGAARR